MEVFMCSAKDLSGAGHKTLSRSSQEEVVDEAIERGSATACWSGLFVAIALVTALWFGDFASEKIGPAWKAIEREATLLTRQVNAGRTPQVVTDYLRTIS
jgi:hypothetical protein